MYPHLFSTIFPFLEHTLCFFLMKTKLKRLKKGKFFLKIVTLFFEVKMFAEFWMISPYGSKPIWCFIFLCWIYYQLTTCCISRVLLLWYQTLNYAIFIHFLSSFFIMIKKYNCFFFKFWNSQVCGHPYHKSYLLLHRISPFSQNLLIILVYDLFIFLILNFLLILS